MYAGVLGHRGAPSTGRAPLRPGDLRPHAAGAARRGRGGARARAGFDTGHRDICPRRHVRQGGAFAHRRRRLPGEALRPRRAAGAHRGAAAKKRCYAGRAAREPVPPGTRASFLQGLACRRGPAHLRRKRCAIRLTRTEFDLVCALMHRPCKVFTKRELFAAAWREEPVVEEKTVNNAHRQHPRQAERHGHRRLHRNGVGHRLQAGGVGVFFRCAAVRRPVPPPRPAAARRLRVLRRCDAMRRFRCATLAPPLPWAPCRRTPAPAAASACPAPASSFPILSLSYNFAEGFRKPRR